MIKSTQKIVTIGSSKGVTLPAKDLKRLNLNTGDEVEVTVKSLKDKNASEDARIFAEAKKVLKEYRKDFENLADR